MENKIVTGFDGKNFWPFKILAMTEKTATVISCNPDGSKTFGEAKKKKIKYNSGGPAVQFHECEIVYLDRPYKQEDFMKYSDI